MRTLTTLYIVRHGQSTANATNDIVGTNPDLTQKGVMQAKKLASKFKHIRFDAVFASDLIRARRTAEIAVAERNLAVTTHKALRERFFGPFEGKTGQEYSNAIKKQIREYQLLSNAEKYRYRYYQGYETDEEVTTRFITYIREIAVGYAGKTVLIVSHGSAMKAFLIRLGWIQHGEIQYSAIPNTAYIHLESDGIDFFVKQVSSIRK